MFAEIVTRATCAQSSGDQTYVRMFIKLYSCVSLSHAYDAFSVECFALELIVTEPTH